MDALTTIRNCSRRSPHRPPTSSTTPGSTKQLRLKAASSSPRRSAGRSIRSRPRRRFAPLPRSVVYAGQNARSCAGRDAPMARSARQLRRGQSLPAQTPVDVDESLLGVIIVREKAVAKWTTSRSPRATEPGCGPARGLVALLSVPFRGPNYRCDQRLCRPSCFSNRNSPAFGGAGGAVGHRHRKARLYERVVDIEEQLRQNEKLSALGCSPPVAHEIRNPLT